MLRRLITILITGLVVAFMIGEAFAKSAGGPRGPAVTPSFNAAARPAAKPATTTTRPVTPPTTRPAFNRESGARINTTGSVHVTPTGRINPNSRAPGFNTASGATPRPAVPKSVVDAGGQRLRVPKGAMPPVPTRTDRGRGVPNGGLAYKNPSTGVTLRIMPPRPKNSKAPPYPHGYAVYTNRQNQIINPQTGKPATSKDPYRGHIPLRPR